MRECVCELNKNENIFIFAIFHIIFLALFALVQTHGWLMSATCKHFTGFSHFFTMNVVWWRYDFSLPLKGEKIKRFFSLIYTWGNGKYLAVLWIIILYKNIFVKISNKIMWHWRMTLFIARVICHLIVDIVW